MAIKSVDPTTIAALLILAAAVVAPAVANAAPRKYEFVPSDTRVEDGHKLTRVRLVAGGKLGGYIESEDNLSQSGACFLDDQSRAYGGARIVDDAQLHGLARDSAVLSGRAQLYGSILGHARVGDDAIVHGQVRDNAVVSGEARVNGQVLDNARVQGHAQVYGMASGDAVVDGDDTVYGTTQ